MVREKTPPKRQLLNEFDNIYNQKKKLYSDTDLPSVKVMNCRHLAKPFRSYKSRVKIDSSVIDYLFFNVCVILCSTDASAVTVTIKEIYPHGVLFS